MSLRVRWSWPLLSTAALLACGADETAIARGDRLWADSNFTGALAEYRLALSRGESEAALLRAAHAFALTGELSRARETYQVLLEEEPDHATQAAYDFMVMARRAAERGDRHGVARATEAALEAQPSLRVDELAPILGRYYAETGDPARALDYMERALAAAPPDSAARLLYEIGRLYQSRGDCARALGYLAAVRHALREGADPDGQAGLLGQADWLTGSCAFDIARQAHREGRPTQALAQLETVLRLGVPSNLQDQAWFERGEIMFALGREDDALESYFRVLELNPLGQGQLAERARSRIDQIRFGF